MSIDPEKYSRNEAWLLFQLNSAPVRTGADGDFNAVAIMEVTSGMILGMELVPLIDPEITEFQSRKILDAAESKAGSRPRLFYIPSEGEADHLTRVAGKMGITVERLPSAGFSELTKEAVEGFAAHVSGERCQ